MSVRFGKITKIDPQNMTLQAVIEDEDDLQTFDLPIVFAVMGRMKIYTVPKIGTPVAITFQDDTGVEDGYALGSIYNEEFTPPETGEGLNYVAFDDGAMLKYDESTKQWTIKSGGGGVVIDDTLEVTQGITSQNGIKSSGLIESSVDVIGGGKSLKSHTNGGYGVD